MTTAERIAAALERIADHFRPPDAVLTVPEAARQLRCKPAAIRQKIADGKLRATNVSQGRRPRWRINASDLAAMSEHRKPVKPVRVFR